MAHATVPKLLIVGLFAMLIACGPSDSRRTQPTDRERQVLEKAAGLVEDAVRTRHKIQWIESLLSETERVKFISVSDATARTDDNFNRWVEGAPERRKERVSWIRKAFSDMATINNASVDGVPDHVRGQIEVRIVAFCAALRSGSLSGARTAWEAIRETYPLDR